jgi:hypothetical protein
LSGEIRKLGRHINTPNSFLVCRHSRSLQHYRKFDIFTDCKIPGLQKAFLAAKFRPAFKTTS